MHTEQRVVLVTGAGSGIGRAVALHYGTAGTVVHCWGRRHQPCQEVVTEIAAAGGLGIATSVDITDGAAVEAAMAALVAAHGHIDLLVANAGIAFNAAVEDTDDAMLAELMRTNVNGTFACCRAAFRHMRPRGQGTIITIGSVVSVKGYAQQAAYTASKHAVAGLTKSLCAEAQPHGVRVACVMPGGVATEMVRATRPDLDGAQMIQPEDVASAVAYLAELPPHLAIDSIALRRWAAAP